MTAAWAEQALRGGQYGTGEQWHGLRKITRLSPDDDEDLLDAYLVGEAWWDLVRPLFADVPPMRRYRRSAGCAIWTHCSEPGPLDVRICIEGVDEFDV